MSPTITLWLTLAIELTRLARELVHALPLLL